MTLETHQVRPLTVLLSMGKKEKSAKDAKADTPKKESKAAKPAKSTPKADDGPAPEPAPLALPGGQMDPKLAALFASAKPSEAPPKPVIKPAAPKPVTPKVEPAAEAPANEKKRKRDEQKTAPPAEPPVDAKQKQKEKGKQGPAQEPVAEPAPKKKKDRKGPAAKTENATEPAKEPVKEQKAVKDDSKDVVPASEPSDDELETDEKGTRVKPEDDPRLPRTIFLGNVPTTAMKNPVLKRLKKLLSTHGKLESLRFRSVAPAKAGIPKRAAVLGNQMHPDRDTVHAYAVFAEEAMAEQAAKELNGTVFEEKHLRADMAGKSSEKDHRRTVFVGNLPFDISDGEFDRLFHADMCL